MYVAILAIVLGQSLVLGSARLLVYAALVWLVFHVRRPGVRGTEAHATFGACVPRVPGAGRALVAEGAAVGMNSATKEA